jgi:two-component system sensor histidine kinase VicK
MPSGPALSLQLAANLCGLAAAAGFAAVVLLRVGVGVGRSPGGIRGGLHDALLVAGSVALVAGHAIDGALLPGRGWWVGWCLAGGLVLIALGVAPGRLPDPTAPAEPGRAPAAVLLAAPVLAVPPGSAVVGLAAGMLGGLRAAFGGRATGLVALALALWGAARGLALIEPVATASVLSSFCTIGGAVALAVWIWQVAATQLRAKIIVAFLVTVLALVAGLAVVLSARGASDLVAEEEHRLATSARELADRITGTWPNRANVQTLVLRRQEEQIQRLAAGPEAQGSQALREVLGLLQQDALAVVRLADGEVVRSAAEETVPAGFATALQGSALVDELVGGAYEVRGVLQLDEGLVAVGGGRVSSAALQDPPARAAPDARYAVLAASVAGPQWVEAEARRLPFGVGLDLNGSGPSAGIDRFAAVLAGLQGQGGNRQAVTVDGAPLIAGAEPVVDPLTDQSVGRVVVVRAAEALVALQRDQARQLFVLALLGGVIAAGVAGTAAGRLLAPVQRLTAAAAAVGQGRLDTTADVDTPDEVGTLGRTFDGMTQSLAAQSRQLQEAANEQARLRARLEALTASMSDGLIATDDHGRVITFNPAAARLTGSAPDNVEGLALDEALRLADGRRATDTVGGVAAKEVRAARLPVLGAGREPVPTDVTAAPVRDSAGRVVGRVLVLRDVTREAEIERMKTEFLSNVSHELRTPLTPIRGFADVLARRDVASEEVGTYAEHILESTERLERVVARIVDFAALDSGRMRTTTEVVDVSDLVDDVLAGWSRRAPQRQFQRQIAQGLPPLRTDPAMLTRCLDELVDNAVKFSDEDRPVVVAAAPDRDEAVRLSVTDRGVGFDPERAPALFSEFYQADASETRHFDGLGLGLALVRRIVDELGGDASVESAPDRGAVFHLVLPRADDARRR